MDQEIRHGIMGEAFLSSEVSGALRRFEGLEVP